MKAASWVVVDKQTGKAVMETFNRKTADAINLKKYDVLPILEYLQKLNRDLSMERKSNPTKKFSPAQIAAQKLFAERARAGTLGKGKRKAAVKRKANPVTETLIYGLAPGETRDYMEELMYAGGQKLTQAQIDKVFKAASDAGYHSFRVAGFDPTMKPDFAAAVRRKRNPDKSKPRAYVKRASQITGAPPSKRLQTRRKMALKAPAGYFPNPEPSHDFARIGKPFAFDGRTWKVSQYSHNGKTIEAYTTDRKKFIRREFDVSELMSSRRKTNPAAPMMTGYQVICMHPKKHVVGIFKTMAEAKLVARAMADAKNVPYAVKTVKVHKTHFAI